MDNEFISNYEMAHECMYTAERATTHEKAVIEAMAAQTYAVLALIDELRAGRESGQYIDPANLDAAMDLSKNGVA